MLASRTLLPAAMLAALLFVLALAGSAGAATKNGITPLGPKAGGSVPSGKGLTFRMRVNNPGTGVFVHVCKAKKKNREGLICDDAQLLGPATKRKGVFQVKQTFYDFPGFWLNNPGRYYWQAYHIECTGGSDCKQEGPVTRFRVR